MTNPQTPAPRRRTKTWWIAGVVLALLVPLAGFGASAFLTSVYQQDYDEWLKNDRPELSSSTSLSPMRALDYPGEVHTEDLQAQKEGCAEIGPTRKAIAAAGDELPDLRRIPVLPTLNPSYGRALDQDARRHRLVDSYRSDADDVLAAMQRDCRFDTKFLVGIKHVNDLIEEGESLLDPKGSVDGAWICDYKDGCIPRDQKKLKKYKRLMTQATRTERAELLSLYTDPSCRRTSYGDACEPIADAYAAYLKADGVYNRLIINGTNSQLDVAVDRAKRAWKRFERTTASVLESRHPGLDKISNFVEEPVDADAFFTGVTQLKVRQLLSRKATVNNALL